MIYLSILVAVIGIGLFLLLGGLVEVQRNVLQLREETGAVDLPRPVEVTVDEYAQGQTKVPGIADRERALVLFLSDSCDTCAVLAEELNLNPIDGATILVEAQATGAGQAWIDQNLPRSNGADVDHNGSIAAALNVWTSPTVVRFRYGRPVAAHTVPTLRRLTEERIWLNHNGPDQPEMLSTPIPPNPTRLASQGEQVQ